MGTATIREPSPVPRNTILCGDALSVLRTLPDGCVQTCVTSPPYYGLRSYGTTPIVWGGDSTCKHEWGEYIQPAKTGGTTSPKVHIKGRDNLKIVPASINAFCQQCQGWRGELGQEPTPSLFIAHLVQVFREVGRVLRRDGVLWLNLGDSFASGTNNSKSGTGKPRQIDLLPNIKRGTPDGYKPKDLMLIPHRVAIALQDDGWYVRQDIVWDKPNAMPESVQDRTTRSHEYVFQMTKSERYYYDADAIKEPAQVEADNRVGRVGAYQNLAMYHRGNGTTPTRQAMRDVSMRNARSVWHIPTEPFPGAHYAVMPVALAERCILASSRFGDLVLDPFGGRGTVGLAAKANRRDYLVIDAKPENVAMADHFIAIGGTWKRGQTAPMGRSLWDEEDA